MTERRGIQKGFKLKRHLWRFSVLPAIVFCVNSAPANADIQHSTGLKPGQAAEGKQSQNRQLDAKPSLTFPVDIRQSSDEQLTALTSHWAQLNAAQRRKLLAEVRSRMNRQRSRKTSLMERFADAKSRQYGGPQRVIREVRKTRQADGSILVETRVVRVRPKSAPAASNESLNETQVNSTPQAQEEYANSNQGYAQPRHENPRPRTRVTFGIGFERRQQTHPKPNFPSSQQPASQAENNTSP